MSFLDAFRALRRSGPRPGRLGPRGNHAVKITDPAQIAETLYWGDRATLRISLPTNLIVMQGAFAYGGGWHPFVECLRDGPGALERFYAAYRPRNLAEAYFLDSVAGAAGADLPPWEIPWLGRRERRPPPGEAGLGAEHGVSFYGPASAQKIAAEALRLRETLASIRRSGYRPDEFGDAQGYLLRRDGEWRFFLRGGKHRAAVLAFEGWEHIPVVFKPGWPRCVELERVSEWPCVREGAVSPELAAAVFRRYFEFNGEAQRARLGLAAAPRGAKVI